MSILREFFLGNIVPNEACDIGPAYRKYQKEACDLEQRLLDRLKDEDKRIFQEFSQVELELQSETAEDHFCFGFRLGSRMMMELLGNSPV